MNLAKYHLALTHTYNCFRPYKNDLKALMLAVIFLTMSGQVLSQSLQSERLSDAVRYNDSLGEAQGSLFNVNPFSGKPGFSMPLLNVSGRGEAGFTFNLSREGEWLVSGDRTLVCDEYGNPVYTYNNGYQEPVYEPTWQPAFSGLEERNGLYKATGYASGPGRIQLGEETYGSLDRYSTKIVFTTASGSTHEFVDELTDGRPTPFVEGGLFNEYTNRGRVFKTTDGSMMTFVSDIDIRDLISIQTIWCHHTCTYFPFSGFIYTKDGTRMRVDSIVFPPYGVRQSKITWIEDRNGNRTTFEYNAEGGIHQTKLKRVIDSIGRVYTIDYSVDEGAPYGVSDKITYRGVGGQIRVIRISHKTLDEPEMLRNDSVIRMYSQLFNGFRIGQPFSCGYIPADGPVKPELRSAVWLPDGRAYKFQYDSYARLSRVELPTGGAIELDWDNGSNPNAMYFRVVEVRTYSETGVLASKTKYGLPQTISSNAGRVTESYVDITNHSINGPALIISKERHFYYGTAANSLPGLTSLPDGTGISLSPEVEWNEGLIYKTQTFDSENTNILRESNQSWQQTPPLWTSVTGFQRKNNPRLAQQIFTLSDSNQISKTTYEYDEFLNVTDTYEYDFGLGAPGQFLRRSHTEYVTDPSYTSYGTKLRSLPLQSWISSDLAGENKVSLTEFEYDTYSGDNHASLLSRSNVVGHNTTSYGSNNYLRGNVTGVKVYADVQNPNSAITSFLHYDVLGNVVEMIDAKGNHSIINYNDNFGAPDGEARINVAPTQLNGQNTFAFPTSATNALGWITGFSQVDYYTGQSVDAEDMNGVVNSTFYNDDLDRPTQSISANNLPDFKRQTNIIYDDENRRVETKADLNTFNDNALKSESFYDGLGRTVESRKYESDGGYVASKSVPFLTTQDPETGIWRAGTKATNPYRPGAGEQPVWTTALSDSLGRNIKTITPDGAMIKTEYSGNAVTVTDQSGKQRRSISNALGQLKQLHEPNNAGQLGSVTNPNQPTYYNYDALNNLIQVQQNGVNAEQCGGAANCTQTRTFMYDSISRLKQATNPESGTIQYAHDNNGNLIQRTNARNVVTTYIYDELNRLTNRSYSAPANLPDYEASLPVSYTYDNLPNAKGKLTKVTTGTLSNPFSVTEYQEFDQMGGVLKSQQMTDGVTYNPMTYTYGLSGAMVEEKYPSGRVVKTMLDNDGELAVVQSKKNQNSGYWNYASHFTYTAAGAVSSMQLGNGKWESAQFNSRLQPIQIALGSIQNATDNLKLNFDYGTTNNNGNVKSQQITVPTVGQTQGFVAMQTYSYDALNRINDAKEIIGTTEQWKQTFTYDRYGNRTFNEGGAPGAYLTTNLTRNCATSVSNPNGICNKKKFNPSISPTNNQLISDQDGDSQIDYLYDASGNTIKDSDNRQFIFNSENRQTEVKDANGISIGKYFYDGEGKRVKKQTNTGEVTIFIYDAVGRLVAEYSNQIASNPQVNYLTTDHLGSPRANTDKDGNVTARHDYQPFGEEISRVNYGTDKVRKQFTGYEKDEETELNFAQARYQNAGQGRFTSPDPLMASARKANPQTFNRYSYVINNPLNLVDPLGLKDECPKTVKCDEFGEEIIVFKSRYDPNTSAPGCGQKTIDECAGYVASSSTAPSATSAPTTNPNQTFNPFINQQKSGPLAKRETTSPTTTESSASKFRKKATRGVSAAPAFAINLLIQELANPSQSVGAPTCDSVPEGCEVDEDEQKIRLFHYTDKDGYNGIRATGPNYLFRASNPQSPNHPFGAYFTNLDPGESDLANKIRVPRRKTEYVFSIEVPLSSVSPIRGGRGRFIYYSPTDIRAPGIGSRNPCFDGGC